MSLLRIASVLIALCAITLPVNAFQNREPLTPSGFAIEITNQRSQSIHLLLSAGESKGHSFTVSPYDIVKRADQDSEQVSEVYVAASAEGDAWKRAASFALFHQCRRPRPVNTRVSRLPVGEASRDGNTIRRLPSN